MRKNKDTRGRSYFDIFDQQGQTDVSINYPGTIRAFHQHLEKEEIWFVIQGNFKVVMSDPLEVIYMSENDLLEIKRGRWHGLQVLVNEIGIIMEYAIEKFNVGKPDDFRKPWNEFDKWEIEKK